MLNFCTGQRQWFGENLEVEISFVENLYSAGDETQQDISQNAKDFLLPLLHL